MDSGNFVRGDLLHPNLPKNKVNNISFGNDLHFNSHHIKNQETIYNDIVYNNYYLSLAPNSILLIDRYDHQEILRISGEFNSNFKKILYKYFKDNNIKVVFQTAAGEPLNYICNNYGDFEWFYEHERRDFEHIIISDCPLHESKDNFMFLDFAYLLEAHKLFYQLGWELTRDKIINETVFNLRNDTYDLKHKDEKEFMFSFLTTNPLPHRMYFLNQIIENEIHTGYISMPFKDLEHTHLITKARKERGHLQNEYFWLKYSKDEYIKNIEKVKDYLTSPNINGMDIDFPHENYFTKSYENKEYNKSYIDIFFETHIVHNIGYNNFSEKSILPIYNEKFFILVGSNRFYKLAKEMGINTFLELFGLEGFDEIDSPYEQADEIIKLLLRIDKNTLKEMFISHKDVFKENKRKLFKHFQDQLKPVQEFVIK